MKAAIATLTSSFALALLLSHLGCVHPTRSQPSAAGKQRLTYVALQGIVIRKGWTKTYESWNAGGDEYYVLDVGDALAHERSAEEGVILRPSTSVPFAAFEMYRDKQVIVQGRFVEAEPYEPPADSHEAYPIDIESGHPEARGSGFEVHSMRAAKNPKDP